MGMEKNNGSTPEKLLPINSGILDEVTNDNQLNPKIRLENIVNQVNYETISLALSGDIEKERIGLFIVKSASKWLEDASKRPIPKMLFDKFWFEGEICILFSDTGMGKSISAVQIGNSISKGEPIKAFKLETSKQKVIYFDFELSDKQFEKRCSENFKNHYQFDDKFKRIEIDPSAEIPDNQSFEDYLIKSIEEVVIETGSKVLIIDNLTYLLNEIEKSRDALPFMKKMKELTNKYQLSLLILAHTPKRDLSKPITKNDLSGSKMLINFCDSSFSIGESHSDKNIRYLKQIKARSTEIVYDSENVCNCQIYKDCNFLQFEFIGFGIEAEHLRQQTVKEVENLADRILQLKEEGLSYRDIGSKLGISHMKVKRLYEKETVNNTVTECNKV